MNPIFNTPAGHGNLAIVYLTEYNSLELAQPIQLTTSVCVMELRKLLRLGLAVLPTPWTRALNITHTVVQD